MKSLVSKILAYIELIDIADNDIAVMQDAVDRFGLLYGSKYIDWYNQRIVRRSQARVRITARVRYLISELNKLKIYI